MTTRERSIALLEQELRATASMFNNEVNHNIIEIIISRQFYLESLLELFKKDLSDEVMDSFLLNLFDMKGI